MTKSPAFQFYAKDWLSSSKIALMPPEYEGAYIRLLAYCWDSGDCSLPDDDDQLAALSRLGEGWFKGGSTVLRKCFNQHPTKQGFLTNGRLLEEAEKQAKWSRKSSEGGKASAAKRAESKQVSKGGSRVVQPKVNIASASASAVIDSEDKSSSSPPAPNQVRMPFNDIPPEWKQQAMTEKGWPENVVDDVWANFRDYWRTGKGKNTKREEWSASWRTWYRKENINLKGNKHEATRGNTTESKWVTEGKRLAAKYRSQAYADGQGEAG